MELRYAVLICTCLLTFGSYYCFDLPGALEQQITFVLISDSGSMAMRDSSVYYNLFYTVYAWTNMAMSLLAGILVDRWGQVNCVFLFLGLCLFGQLLWALGPTLTSVASWDRYWVMFAGRFIFGLGGGSITIVQNAITAHWFRNKELAMAFGCTLTASRLGSVINFNLSPLIFEKLTRLSGGNPVFCQPNTPQNPWPTNVTATTQDQKIGCARGLAYTFWFGAGLIGLSFIAAFLWLAMHSKEARRKEESGEEPSSSSAAQRPLLPPDDVDREGAQRSKKSKKTMKLSDIGKLPFSFWICAAIICAFYNIVFPFMAVAKTMLSAGRGVDSPFHLSAQLAGSTASIVYSMSAIISPFLGRTVDYFGRRGMLSIFGTGITIPCFLLLGYTDVPPIVCFIMLGLAYCVCAACLWPSIQKIVDPNIVGTANGIATSMQMFGIGICNIVTGKLMDAYTSSSGVINYVPLLTFFAAMGSVACLLSFVLKFGDMAGDGSLRRGQRDKVALDDLTSIASPQLSHFTSPNAAMATTASLRPPGSEVRVQQQGPSQDQKQRMRHASTVSDSDRRRLY